MAELERKPGLFIAAVSGAFVMALAGMAWTQLRDPGEHDMPAAHAGEDPAAHPPGEHAGAPQLQLDAGRKWATDAPLRQGMEAIRALVAPLGSGRDLTPERAAQVADGVGAQVKYLIANCKLQPKADAVLHVLIAQMLDGAGALAEPATRAEGAARLREALELYPQYFDHPGWQ